jgi:hypothetical protein
VEAVAAGYEVAVDQNLLPPRVAAANPRMLPQLDADGLNSEPDRCCGFQQRLGEIGHQLPLGIDPVGWPSRELGEVNEEALAPGTELGARVREALRQKAACEAVALEEPDRPVLQ